MDRRDLCLVCFRASSGTLSEERTWLGEQRGTWDEDAKVQIQGSSPGLGGRALPSTCIARGLSPNTADWTEVGRAGPGMGGV